MKRPQQGDTALPTTTQQLVLHFRVPVSANVKRKMPSINMISM